MGMYVCTPVGMYCTGSIPRRNYRIAKSHPISFMLQVPCCLSCSARRAPLYQPVGLNQAESVAPWCMLPAHAALRQHGAGSVPSGVE